MVSHYPVAAACLLMLSSLPAFASPPEAVLDEITIRVFDNEQASSRVFDIALPAIGAEHGAGSADGLDRAREAAEGAAENAAERAERAAENAADAAERAAEAAQNAIENAAEAAQDALENAAEAAQNHGGNRGPRK